MLDGKATRRKFNLGVLGLALGFTAANTIPGVARIAPSDSLPPKANLSVDFGNGRREVFADLPGRSVLGLLIATNLDIGVRGRDAGVDIASIDGIPGRWTAKINGVEVGKEGAGQAFPKGAHVEVLCA